MTRELVDRIATALLYEGYLLYPYRASAVKNRHRFNFGVLVPLDYSIAQSGTELWTMRADCLVQGQSPTVRVRTRFLHLVNRQVIETRNAASLFVSSPTQSSRPVEFLEVDGRRYQSWQEAIEREVELPAVTLAQIIDTPYRFPFEFGQDQTIEVICNDHHEQVGSIVRTHHQLQGTLSLQATRLADNLYRPRVAICNHTSLPDAADLVRDQALLHSLVSTHIVLNVDDGAFVSLLDPPVELTDAVATCHPLGCWPILVGEKEDRRTMLASPIILYDYPQIAEESPGDFFDGTEIDEMLMLRVMTMTPEEQWEMRHVDEQARRLLERTQAVSQEDLLKLHGVIRGGQPVERPPNANQEHGSLVKS